MILRNETGFDSLNQPPLRAIAGKQADKMDCSPACLE
jgi:hypothetical protein